MKLKTSLMKSEMAKKKIQHNGWWYFVLEKNLNHNMKHPPWLWKFNVEYDYKKGKYVVTGNHKQ